MSTLSSGSVVPEQNRSSSKKKSMFVTSDGQNVLFTFILVSSLFLLWGFCNGMIDVMDKHFQEELHLTLSQSAWVQFAHYLGYFLMSLPAGWLAHKLGYKGGIIAGLLLVAVGGFWFIPATKIAAFWAFLLGVCLIASGLTFLETIANPYTTVLGPKQYAATRINLAQSCNGIGWFFGPIAGAMFFYSKDATGKSTGAETLWIPYAAVGVVVVVLAAVFFFARVPDIKAEDDYQIEGKDNADAAAAPVRQVNRKLVYAMLVLNGAVLIWIVGIILLLILSAFKIVPSATQVALAGGVALVILALKLVSTTRTLSHQSIWAHPHFSGATLAQFFYVAAQAGIFSFLINYMTSEPPAVPEAWKTGMDNMAANAPGFLQGFLGGWFELNVKTGHLSVSNKLAAYLASFGFLCFLTGRIIGAALLRRVSAHRILGLYGVLNTMLCLVVFFKLGWLSAVAVFLSYFFMSIMFPTIFALGIFGLGIRAKRASAYIVMAIMGGAVLPKIMGSVADHYDMSRAFIVPMVCFILIAAYGYFWPKFSSADSLHGVGASRSH